MVEILPTLTLRIGEPDPQTGVYPLGLSADGAELARAEIAQKEFDRADPAEWEADPIETFREEPDASVEFKKIGKKLYSLLHRGEVGKKWDEFRRKHESHRVQLEIKPEEIAAFPWELAYGDDISWLAVSDPAQTFIRFAETAVKAVAGDSLPLRVLIVIGAEDDDEAVAPLEEVRRIEAEIYDYDRAHADNKLIHRMIDFEILKRPDLAALEKAYIEMQPHIFHFIGHGGINSDDEAFLLLKHRNEAGELAETEWLYETIYAKFKAWKWIPRFVFVNACRTEVANLSGRQIQEQAWSIGRVFRRLGVPAVLTMQADIDGRAAGIFGATIYKALARLERLDTAVAYARSAMINSAEQLKKRDWAIPALTVAIAPEELLPFRMPGSDLEKIKACEAFKEIEPFTDRTDVRRRLIRGLYPLPPAIVDKSLVIVSGEEEAGKTWLVKWFLEVCALLGNDVRYVEVGGREGKTWLDVLLQIRSGDQDKRNGSLIYEELGEAAFHKFYWELEHRFNGAEPPVFDGQKPIVRDDYKLADSKWTEKFFKETIPSFVQCLVQSAEINRPLVVVLDHFQGILEDDMKKQLIPELFREAARGKLSLSVGDGETRAVKLIVVLTETQFRDFDVKNLIGDFYPVSINFLSPKTFFDVATEYLRKVSRIEKLDYSEDDIRDAAEGIARLIMKKNQNYSPAELRKRFS